MDAEKKIMFLGGSITVGGAASDYSLSWASRTYNKIAEPLFNNNCTMLNASLSGTGSFIAAVRLGQHVLPYKPDMVFIEFAVNDYYEAKSDKELVVSSLDYIVRSLIAVNPKVVIVFVYTSFSGKNAAETHGIVAKHYNIPEIDFQSPMAEKIAADQKSWSDYMPDGVHPNDEGHLFYANIAAEAILRDKERFLTPTKLAPSLATYSFCDPKILLASSEIEQNGFVCAAANDMENLKHLPETVVRQALYAEKAGASVKVKFTGTHFAIYHRINAKMGCVSVAIDGENVGKLDCYYKYADPEISGEYCCFFRRNGLPQGEHIAEITVLDEKNENSTGNQVVLAGFLVG
ncbi:MAG: SGNH/GDSL hydrolase family protein [Oscillospiraceae bacterium]|nr:SGNH/GDSL hydrolase family protein [Oscillospiraceae bacterium]